MIIARRTRTLFAVSLALLCALPTHADEVSKRAKLEELFRMIKIESSMTQMLDQQNVQIKQMLQGMFPQLTPDQMKDVDRLMERAQAITRDSMSWQKLQPQYLELYASTYSESEVDGILAFYNSPAGRQMIAQQPELIRKSQSITQGRMAEMQPKLRALIEDYAREMQAKGEPKSSAK